MGSPMKWASAFALTLLGMPLASTAQTTAPEAEKTGETTGSVAVTTEVAAEAAPKSEPAPASEPAAVTTTTTTQATAEPTAPVVTTTEVVAVEKEDDHMGVVGRIGVGLLGSTTAMTVNPDFTANRMTLPIIGARYWVSERLGLQAGVGVMHQSGDNDQNTLRSGFDTPTSWGFAVHVGAPFAFFHDKHYKFILQPEANFVAVTGRTNDNANLPGDQGVSVGGWGLDLGARAGAEVHFGFIGIPMLSLQGSVGLAYQLRQAKLTSVVNGQEVVQTKTEHAFGTAHYSDPWDLFTSSIAALYYF